MIGDEAARKLVRVASWRTPDEWLAEADRHDSIAEQSFDAATIRWHNETRRLLEAVARWRQMDEETS